MFWFHKTVVIDVLSSGYIAGGAIAGIIIAFMAGALEKVTRRLTETSAAHNPFFSEETWNGHRADGLALLPFAALCVFLYLVARGKLITSRPRAQTLPGATRKL